MTESSLLPRKIMLQVAVAQGLLLFALYKAFDLDYWPSEDPLWSFPLWTLSLVLPLMFLLSIERGNEKRVLAMTGGLGAVLLLLSVYVGWQAQPFDEFPVNGLVGAFALSISIACFKALMYLQQRAARLPMSYGVLFTYSWQNFLVLVLSTLFVLVFWGILLLWAGLFKVIEIHFFADLFEEDWFIFPVLGFANGLGIIVFRELTRVIDSITRLLQGLIKLLLPLIVGVAAIFLLALPFTGLDALWATGSGTSLLLWLIALILFFTNAVYQDGRGEAPYPNAVHRLVYLGMFVLPFLCMLSFYGLWLRLDQYGWTVERAWAFVVWAMFALFCAGYLWGIVKHRAQWPTTLGRVNTVMGWVVLATMLTANSPLMDFRKISLASQLARLEAGDISLDKFDFYYAHHYLARPGHIALEQLKADIGDSNPDLLAKIDNPQRIRSTVGEQAIEEFWRNVFYRPQSFEVPADVKILIENNHDNANAQRTAIVKADLNEDGQDEYVVLPINEYSYGGQYYWLEDGRWQQGYLSFDKNGLESDAAATELKEGQMSLVEPPFKSLKIGKMVFKPR